MSWFYPAKVNVALAAMAVRPDQFRSKWRSGMQQIGMAGGLTPQETALVIVGYGLGTNYPSDVETALLVWQQEGKVDPSKPEMKEALSRMGFRMSNS